MSLINPPAMAGPAIIATDSAAWSLALPSPISWDSTISGR